MTSILRRVFVPLVIMGSFASAASADLVTYWDFNSAVPDNNTATGTTAPAIGSGTLNLVGGTTATFASGAANGGSSDPVVGDDSAYNTTTYAAQGTGDKTRGIQFNVSTLGFEDISVVYDIRHSNTSSRYEQFQYSTDGVTFIDFGTPFDGNAGDTWFNNRTIDLSGIAAVDNLSSFSFRVVATFAPGTSTYAPANATSTYGTAGTLRFDAVEISGTQIRAVPEPASFAMLGLGGLTALAVRRRRTKAA